MRVITGILGVALLSFASGWASGQGTYRLTDLGTLGGTFSSPTAINASGQVTGTSNMTGDTVQHAFLWNGTSMQDLGTLGGTNSFGSGINASGQVTGNSDMTGDSVQHAFLWNGTSMQDLGTLGGSVGSNGTAINDSGQVTGNAFTAGNAAVPAFLWDGTAMQNLGTLGGSSSIGVAINASGQVTGNSNMTGDASFHAILWNGTALQDLGTLGGTSSHGLAINVSGQVTGSANTTGDAAYHAFLWNGTAMQDLGTLGGTNSSGKAINASGRVAGDAAITGDSGQHAFLWNGTAMQDLGTLGGSVATTYAINASGQVTGQALTTGDAVYHAFLWDGTAMQDLNALVDPADPLQPFVQLGEGVGINDLGQIAATGWDGRTGETHAYLVSPVTVTDTTPPVIQSNVSGTLGNGGWYVSNVQVAWTVTDAESAISTSTGCGPTTVTVDTARTTFTCRATSAGGTSTKSVTIKRDASKPAIFILSPPENLTFRRGQKIPALYWCWDFTSGTQQCQGTVPFGAWIDTATAGMKTFTVNARNKAGGTAAAAVHYRVSSR